LKRFLILALLALCANSGVSAKDALPNWSADVAVDPTIPVVLVAEMGSGQVLYARQSDLRFAPASITKVMTAYTAFELIEQRKLLEEQRFVISDRTFAEWNGKGTSMNLRQGESVPVHALLRGITTVSANDAAVVLAEGAGGSLANWTTLMNAQARKLGMTSSFFGTPNGWMDDGATYVSARDLLTLSSALITRHSQQYRRYFGKQMMVWNGVTQQNRDPAIGVVAGADGIKTGYTGEAGYNYLGSAERDGQRLIVVIGGASNEEQRAIAARTLLEWGFSNWDSRPLFAAGATIGEAQVQGGNARNVVLRTDRAVTIALPGDGRPRRLSLRLVYRGPLQAPLKAGAPLAELELLLEGMPPSRVPLVAANDISTAGPLDRLWNGLMGLFS
jgi:serine-type D-Ala-D-Ala carboxypeptidase (penicillin-binding protein 5/6)